MELESIGNPGDVLIIEPDSPHAEIGKAPFSMGAGYYVVCAAGKNVFVQRIPWTEARERLKEQGIEAEPCKHFSFRCEAGINRIGKDGNPREIQSYSADIKISCWDCGQPFEFFGLPVGVSSYHPMVSFDGLELRAPLVIPGTQPPAGLPGFGVKVRLGPQPEPIKQ